jgi:hypothetical protein
MLYVNATFRVHRLRCFELEILLDSKILRKQ